MVSLGRGHPKLKSMARVEDSLGGINGYMFMPKISFQVGGHWLDMEKDEFCDVCFPKTHYT